MPENPNQEAENKLTKFLASFRSKPSASSPETAEKKYSILEKLGQVFSSNKKESVSNDSTQTPSDQKKEQYKSLLEGFPEYLKSDPRYNSIFTRYSGNKQKQSSIDRNPTIESLVGQMSKSEIQELDNILIKTIIEYESGIEKISREIGYLDAKLESDPLNKELDSQKARKETEITNYREEKNKHYQERIKLVQYLARIS